MQRVLKVARKRNHNEDPKVILLFLLEELGEVARAHLRESGHKGDNDRVLETVKQEMGDVFFLLLHLAAVEGIDMEEALGETIGKLEKRIQGDM